MFFEQQHRESAKLAFPGLVYKMGNQEGGYYPNAHTQSAATTHKAHVSAAAATSLLTSDT